MLYEVITLRDLGAACEVIQLLVGTDAQLESVVFGSEGSGGLVDGMAPEGLYRAG